MFTVYGLEEPIYVLKLVELPEYLHNKHYRNFSVGKKR
jgi:hypothetical protein